MALDLPTLTTEELASALAAEEESVAQDAGMQVQELRAKMLQAELNWCVQQGQLSSGPPAGRQILEYRRDWLCDQRNQPKRVRR